MSTNNGIRKRKQTTDPSSGPQKKSRTEAPQALIAPHEAIIAELSPKHNVLAASIISSTQIRKRVAHVTSHLLEAGSPAGQSMPHLAMLHARTAEVCKMITVVEQCKRVFGEHGKSWYQYNQLFDLPADAKKRKKKDVIEETTLEKEQDSNGNSGSDSETDAFETMENRFEMAVLPPPRARTYKSLRIFLSLEPVTEFKSRPDITVQSGDEAAS